MRSPTQQRETGSGRRKAFRIVAGVLGVSIVALSLPLTIQSFTDDAQSIHRLHNLAGVFGFGLLLGGSLLVMARTPESIGPFWVATASGVATAIAGIVSGDFISGIYYTAPIGIAILFALHPDRRALLDIRGFDLPTVVLALVSLVPAIAFALTQSELQRNGFVSDPHVEFHHYSGVASYALGDPARGVRRLVPRARASRGRMDRRADRARAGDDLAPPVRPPGCVRCAVGVAPDRMGDRDHRARGALDAKGTGLHTMTERGSRRLAWALFISVIVMLVAGLVFEVLGTAQASGSWEEGGLVGDLIFVVTFSLFPIVGLVLATRRPSNAIGWVMLGIGVAFGLSALTTYGPYALEHGLPGAAATIALSSWLWVPTIGVAGSFLLLLFPDGHLPVSALAVVRVVRGRRDGAREPADHVRPREPRRQRVPAVAEPVRDRRARAGARLPLPAPADRSRSRSWARPSVSSCGTGGPRRPNACRSDGSRARRSSSRSRTRSRWSARSRHRMRDGSRSCRTS